MDVRIIHIITKLCHEGYCQQVGDSSILKAVSVGLIRKRTRASLGNKPGCHIPNLSLTEPSRKGSIRGLGSQGVTHGVCHRLRDQLRDFPGLSGIRQLMTLHKRFSGCPVYTAQGQHLHFKFP